jgi:hypothetical protein
MGIVPEMYGRIALGLIGTGVRKGNACLDFRLLEQIPKSQLDILNQVLLVTIKRKIDEDPKGAFERRGLSKDEEVALSMRLNLGIRCQEHYSSLTPASDTEPSKIAHIKWEDRVVGKGERAAGIQSADMLDCGRPRPEVIADIVPYNENGNPAIDPEFLSTL